MYRNLKRCLIICSIVLIAGYVTYLLLRPYLQNNIHIKHTIPSKIKASVQWLSAHTTWHQVGTPGGWAGFDKVYFIAMPERIENVKQVAARLGISDSAWILQAIHKNTINAEELAALNIVHPEYLAKLKQYGVIGCQLSHLAVILDCYKDPNVQTCVIFEDDIYKPSKAVTAQVVDFRRQIESLKIDWDILFLDYCLELGGGKTKEDIRWLTGSYCAHAYVIKKDIAPLLLSATTPMREPIDGVYFNLMQDNSLVAIGPDKAHFFAQNRYGCDSCIDPGYIENVQLVTRYR